MGIRFRKSVKIAPGVHLNIGKESAGVSVGSVAEFHIIAKQVREKDSRFLEPEFHTPKRSAVLQT